jgi:hypothetical protein
MGTTHPIVSIGTSSNITSYVTYANDSAFVTGKGSSAANGDTYYNTTTNVVRQYLNGAWANCLADNSVTVKDANLVIQDDGDTTKQFKFQASGITTATTRTLTVPDADTTIVGTGATQTLSSKTLDNTNAITVKDTNFTLQDDGDTTKQVQLQLSGITTGNTRTLTVPDASLTLVGTATSQTLTNKYYQYTKTATKTGTYAATTADDVIPVDGTSGAFSVNLFAASGNSGKRLTFIRTDNTIANAVTIDANASETINGALTFPLYTQYEQLSIVCDGSNWFIEDHYIDGTRISWTPTGSWSANTTYTGTWRRINDTAELQVKVALSGAPTSATLTINMPTSISIDTAKLIGSTQFVPYLGNGIAYDVSALTTYPAGLAYSSSTVVSSTTTTAATSNFVGITQAAPFTFATGDEINFLFTVPVTNWKP